MEETTQEFQSRNNASKPNSFCQTVENYIDWLGCWIIHLMFFFGPILFFYMCFKPSLQIFAAAYLFWMYYDRETPHRGGRKLEWFRKLRFWRYRRDYFPIKLVKTTELPPDTTYLFASFPHGFFASGATTNVMTYVNHIDKVFPGLNVYKCSLGTNLKIPFTRELLLSLGVCSCSRESLLHLLNGPPGNVAVLTVGGLAEMNVSYPGTNRIILKNRKGFVKLALKTGSSLVPVYTFGEPDIYETRSFGEWWTWIQNNRRFGLDAILFIGSFAYFKGPSSLGHLFGILPYQRPLTTVVGKPIKLPKVENPSNELVDKYHEIFMHEMSQLFDEYKVEYDLKGAEATLSIE